MTEKQKENLAAMAVLVVLLLLVLWALFHAFGGAARAVMGGPTYNRGNGPVGGDVTIDQGSPYAPADTGGGCCGSCGGGGGCPISPNAIQSLNQIYATGAAATNSIYAAGNATIQAMEDIYNQADPLYAYTTG